MIPGKDKFESFGRLRNGIQHFAAPAGVDTAYETLKFVFEVIDPFINSCWGLFAINYDEDYEPYIYLVGSLVAHEIPFLVSGEAAQHFEEWNVDWTNASVGYRELIESRVNVALRTL